MVTRTTDDKFMEAYETVKRKIEEKGHKVKVGLFTTLTAITMGHAYAAENKGTPDIIPTDSVTYHTDSKQDYFEVSDSDYVLSSLDQYNAIIRGKSELGETDMAFVKKAMQLGFIKVSDVESGHAVQVESTFTEDEVRNLEPDDKDAYSAAYAQEYQNMGQGELDDGQISTIKRALTNGYLSVNNLESIHAVQIGNTLSEEDVQNIEPKDKESYATAYAQLYQTMKSGELDAGQLSTVKHGIENGFLSIDNLEGSHAVQVANSLSPDELNNWGPQKMQSLANVYIASHNEATANGGKADINVLAEALNGPLGQMCMAQDGLSLNVNNAQDLLSNNKVDLNHLGMDGTTFLKRAVNDSYTQMGNACFDSLTPEQSVQVANSLSPDEQNNWGTQKMQALANVYIAAHNQTFDKCQIGNVDLLADALNGPLGQMYMAQDGGISLNIQAAEALLDNGKLNLGQLGMTQDAFLTRALNDTYEKLPSKMSYMAPGADRDGVESMLIDKAYKYAKDANNTYMGNMNDGTSSTMGSYALQKVFKDKTGKDFTPDDKIVLDNVTQDIIRNQDNMVAIGNYDRLCLEFADRSPEYYKAFSSTWRGNQKALSQYEQTQEGLARAYLIGCLNDIHNPSNLDKGKALASHQSVLQQCEVRACESQKYLAIYDLSVAYDYAASSVKSGDFDKINSANMNGRGYTSETNSLEPYTARQKDFVMYMKYKGMQKANMTDSAGYNAEDMQRIEAQYGADFLALSYNYVEALHSKNGKALGSAKQALYEGHNLIVPSEYSKNAHKKGIYSINDLRSNLKVQSSKYVGADRQWNGIVNKELPRGLYSNALGNDISSDRVQAAFASARAKARGSNGEATVAARDGANSQQSVWSVIGAYIDSKIHQA